jgi:DNA polymerase III epsilon subunit family exonuclease
MGNGARRSSSALGSHAQYLAPERVIAIGRAVGGSLSFGDVEKLTPSDSQRAAIEAEPRPQLVLAGPGAGKTYCLIERIRHLIEVRRIPAERIYAFTFTNKAAEEVANRLDAIGEAAHKVNRSTIHRFCVDVLREFGERVNVPVGFGIADEDYQLSLMWRFEANPRKHQSILRAFRLHHVGAGELGGDYARKFEGYNAELKKQNLLDFDQLLTKTAELIQHVPDVGADVRGRYGAILVDEFQDLNRVQYALVRELARDHKNVFAVGDFDQSIYGWAGADTTVFQAYMNDFEITAPISLVDNRRCPKQVFALARKLVNANTPLLEGLSPIIAEKPSPFPVAALGFEDHDAEVAWIIRDIQEQAAQHKLPLGEFALLYRKHEIGDIAEPALLTAGIPCRLAHGRAVAEDPVVAYVAAALRIIANPDDRVLQETFLGLVLPKTLMNAVKAEAESSSEAPIDRLRRRWRDKDEDGRKIRRGLYAVKNFNAVSRRHTSVATLIDELLAQRVGEYKTPLEREHTRISDPETIPEAVALALRINSAITYDRPVTVPVLGGAGIALKAILHEVGVRTVHVTDAATKDAERITQADAAGVGELPVTLFKAAQILTSKKFATTFRDFVSIDLETTGKDVGTCEVVEVGAVRVRNGKPVAEFHTRVKPTIPIEPGATATHGLSAADVASSPSFAEIWPALQDFCGNDMLVAHNGYRFDFPIIKRMAAGLTGAKSLSTYDSLPLAKELNPDSRSLENLAKKFDIDTGRSHSALDDARTLARVFVRLTGAKLSLTRKACLAGVLDHLAVALSLTGPHAEDSEAKLLLDCGRTSALGSYSQCLEYYSANREELAAVVPSSQLPSRDDLIEALGGVERMLRIQAEKSADERYPIAMMRIRRLLAGTEGTSMKDQIATFLERVALSFADGQQPDNERVNLLTLHSTKGLEFSRVYIVGVEDGQFLSERTTKPELEEARRVLYVGMTRAKDRLVMTRSATRGGKVTGGTQFLDEMGLTVQSP